MNTVIDVKASPNAAPKSESVQGGKELTILQ